MGKPKSVLMGVIGFIILVLADQWTKKMAVLRLKDQDPIVLIKNVFELYYLENRGAAFGIFQGKRVIFLIITIIILLFLAYCFWRIPYTRKYATLRGVLVLIAAGAVGNFIDRMYNGYVVDFFYFKVINFPIFNVADIYVTCSAIFLAVLLIFCYKEEDLNQLLKSLKGLKGK
ncbi:signal peptidase II [Eubacterium ramulus]|uniref:signal peptidase II n=1 Tax=Eubacterium ramulus TaxID=39490 RepID=UPI0039927BE4